MTHVFAVRVYYEDTDLGGIVYYANYLKFIERARSEWVRALGVDQLRLKADGGLAFAVRRIEADYLRPARFDDALQVETAVTGFTGARLCLSQDVTRDGVLLFASRVVLVCVTSGGKAARLPAPLHKALALAVEDAPV